MLVHMTFERNDGIWISDIHKDRITQLCARYWDPLLFHSLSSMWWEWNSNPSAPRLSNRVFYDTHRCVTLIRNRRAAVFFFSTCQNSNSHSPNSLHQNIDALPFRHCCGCTEVHDLLKWNPIIGSIFWTHWSAWWHICLHISIKKGKMCCKSCDCEEVTVNSYSGTC